ncbi:HEAT repeat domain-containing protein [Patescibacteria group bacterium]|nr:HEAT repeat domain-containing protein [Patescibacteria group bacterium]
MQRKILTVSLILFQLSLTFITFTNAADFGSPRALKEQTIALLQESKSNNTTLNSKLDFASNSITKSLNDKYWDTDWRLLITDLDFVPYDPMGLAIPDTTIRVFTNEQTAVSFLNNLEFAQKETCLKNLADADKIIVNEEIKATKIYQGINDEIDAAIKSAEEFYQEGVNSITTNPLQAVEKFKKAWEKVIKAKGLLTQEAKETLAQKAVLDMENGVNLGDHTIIFAAAFMLQELDKTAVPYLLSAIKDETKNEMLRMLLIELLGSTDDETVIADLKEILATNQSEVLRSEAAQSLAFIKQDKAVAGLIYALENDPSSNVRSSAALSLGVSGNETAIPALINALNDSNNMVRTNALRGLGGLKATTALPQIKAKLNDPDKHVRYTAAQIIKELGGKSEIADLLPALKDEDTFVRESALETLKSLVSSEDTLIIPDLINTVVNDRDGQVSRAAAEVLIKIGPPAVADLITAYSSANKNARVHLAYALGEIGSPEAIPVLTKTLSSDHKTDAINAAFAIYKLGDKDNMYNFIVNILQDENEYDGARESAAIVLGKMGDKRAVPALENALQDEELFVRGAAAIALYEITGKKYECDWQDNN